ncbi:MAG: 50S ribosomal protein L15 [Actinobacteria bacterium]|nr:50S ribosomal protein L15 [Actinomycetota bacterium]
MRLDNLKPASGSKKNRKRVGRGLGSGHGVTAGRGTKGQKARSGGGKGPGFEGGQTPFYRRLPRFPGFTNIFKVEYTPINLDQLNVFADGEEVTIGKLIEKGLIRQSDLPIKILGRGELKSKLSLVQANSFSKKAKEAIEANGGKVEILP